WKTARLGLAPHRAKLCIAVWAQPMDTSVNTLTGATNTQTASHAHPHGSSGRWCAKTADAVHSAWFEYRAGRDQAKECAYPAPWHAPEPLAQASTRAPLY